MIIIILIAVVLAAALAAGLVLVVICIQREDHHGSLPEQAPTWATRAVRSLTNLHVSGRGSPPLGKGAMAYNATPPPYRASLNDSPSKLIDQPPSSRTARFSPVLPAPGSSHRSPA